MISNSELYISRYNISHSQMSHITHVDELCHTYQAMGRSSDLEFRVMHQEVIHITHVKESCHTCEGVMSHA